MCVCVCVCVCDCQLCGSPTAYFPSSLIPDFSYRGIGSSGAEEVAAGLSGPLGVLPDMLHVPSNNLMGRKESGGWQYFTEIRELKTNLV